MYKRQTFSWIGAWLSDGMTVLVDACISWLDAGLSALQINPVVHSLVVDGIANGVGSVLSFLPTIVTLFFFLSILEDTGYMARVAFIMDRPLRKLGLSGRSFVPMLVGFGCSVPAIMATRTPVSYTHLDVYKRQVRRLCTVFVHADGTQSIVNALADLCGRHAHVLQRKCNIFFNNGSDKLVRCV